MHKYAKKFYRVLAFDAIFKRSAPCVLFYLYAEKTGRTDMVSYTHIALIVRLYYSIEMRPAYA